MSTTVNPDDSTVVFTSPWTTYRPGDGSVFTANPGWCMKFTWTGTSLSLTFDTSAINNNYASFGYSVDGAAETRHDMQTTDTSYTFATGLTDTTHSFVLNFKASAGVDGANRWTGTPAASMHVTGIVLDTGKACSLPTLLPGRAMFICDSIGEGVDALGVGSTYSLQDATNAWTRVIAPMMLCESGIIAYASQGLVVTGLGAVPNAVDAWGLYYASHSRLTGGLLTPEPHVVITGHGANGNAGDETAMGTLLTDIRAAAPHTWIVVAINWKGDEITPLTNAVNTFADSKCVLVNIGRTNFDNNSPHLTNLGATQYANALFPLLPNIGVAPGTIASPGLGRAGWESFNRLVSA